MLLTAIFNTAEIASGANSGRGAIWFVLFIGLLFWATGKDE